jgi:hypothetical protein
VLPAPAHDAAGERLQLHAALRGVVAPQRGRLPLRGALEQRQDLVGAVGDKGAVAPAAPAARLGCNSCSRWVRGAGQCWYPAC